MKLRKGFEFLNLTPERMEELKQKRLDNIRNMSLEFQLGIYIGEHIVQKYLPTLTVDLISTNKRIEVSSEDTEEYNRLDEAWNNKINQNRHLPNASSSAPEEWDALMRFRRRVESKYLPKVLECHVHPINVKNEVELKNGIISALWNSDVSHYRCSSPDDVKITHDENGYYSEITLFLGD